MKKSIFKLLTILTTVSACAQVPNNKLINKSDMTEIKMDNSNKRILARGCDPELSLKFSKAVPPMIGNAEYIPTTDDVDFIEKLKSQKWSVIYFAPGACRLNAVKKQLPGGSIDTQGWLLDDYKKLIYELQGSDIQIVESIYEEGAIELLNSALTNAKEVK